ncbi:MAG: hypothetical protein ABIR79_08475 [Candidatus Binatia bacterium]
MAVLAARDAWWRSTFGARLRERAGEDPAAQLRAILDYSTSSRLTSTSTAVSS